MIIPNMATSIIKQFSPGSSSGYDMIQKYVYIQQQLHFFVFCEKTRIMRRARIISVWAKHSQNFQFTILQYYYGVVRTGKFTTATNYMVYSFYTSFTQSTQKQKSRYD